jgi:hypothetical protein
MLYPWINFNNQSKAQGLELPDPLHGTKVKNQNRRSTEVLFSFEKDTQESAHV